MAFGGKGNSLEARGEGEGEGKSKAGETLKVKEQAGGGASSSSSSSGPLVDTNSPIVSVSVRLPTGSRFIVKLNATHSTSDLRDVVSGRVDGEYELYVGYPMRKVEGGMLADIGVDGEVVTVRRK